MHRNFAEYTGSVALPLAVGAGFLLFWELAVRLTGMPAFVLPAPSRIAEAFAADFPMLMAGLFNTFLLAFGAFVLAALAGIGLAVLFARSRTAERALMPYAVTLQVTPVVAIAPLILIWVGYDHPDRAVLILAAIVAFFPILSNTTLGLRSADRNLADLFRLYGASRAQEFWRLRLPTALPHLLAGMKISAGLSLIAVVTAEFVAASGESGGLPATILEAGNRLQIPRMFAALFLLSALGITAYFSLSALERRILGRWHESAAHSHK